VVGVNKGALALALLDLLQQIPNSTFDLMELRSTFKYHMIRERDDALGKATIISSIYSITKYTEVVSPSQSARRND